MLEPPPSEQAEWMTSPRRTVRPLRLVADALKDVTAPGDVVLDTFLGSGTTILAAERVGRPALAPEIDPKYAAIAVRRGRQLQGVRPYTPKRRSHLLICRSSVLVSFRSEWIGRHKSFWRARLAETRDSDD
jgi:hypothetical protein